MNHQVKFNNTLIDVIECKETTTNQIRYRYMHWYDESKPNDLLKTPEMKFVNSSQQSTFFNYVPATFITQTALPKEMVGNVTAQVTHDNAMRTIPWKDQDARVLVPATNNYLEITVTPPPDVLWQVNCCGNIIWTDSQKPAKFFFGNTNSFPNQWSLSFTQDSQYVKFLDSVTITTNSWPVARLDHYFIGDYSTGLLYQIDRDLAINKVLLKPMTTNQYPGSHEFGYYGPTLFPDKTEWGSVRTKKQQNTVTFSFVSGPASNTIFPNITPTGLVKFWNFATIKPIQGVSISKSFDVDASYQNITEKSLITINKNTVANKNLELEVIPEPTLYSDFNPQFSCLYIEPTCKLDRVSITNNTIDYKNKEGRFFFDKQIRSNVFDCNMNSKGSYVTVWSGYPEQKQWIYTPTNIWLSSADIHFSNNFTTLYIDSFGYQPITMSVISWEDYDSSDYFVKVEFKNPNSQSATILCGTKYTQDRYNGGPRDGAILVTVPGNTSKIIYLPKISRADAYAGYYVSAWWLGGGEPPTPPIYRDKIIYQGGDVTTVEIDPNTGGSAKMKFGNLAPRFTYHSSGFDIGGASYPSSTWVSFHNPNSYPLEVDLEVWFWYGGWDYVSPDDESFYETFIIPSNGSKECNLTFNNYGDDPVALVATVKTDTISNVYYSGVIKIWDLSSNATEFPLKQLPEVR